MITLEKVREEVITYLPIEQIATNPYQPRKFFDKRALEELSDSIKEYGIMQPINVRKMASDTYELVAGERRLRASKLAGLKVIPAIIINITDQSSAILALIENLQRQDLNYLEEAEGFQNLIEDYNFTQEQLAKKVGKTQSTVANKLRILRLSDNIKEFLILNNLSERHARALLKLEKLNENEETVQMEILKRVVEEGLTVKLTEKLVDKTLNKYFAKPEEDKKVKQNVRKYIGDIRLFTNTVEQAVGIMKESGIETIYEIEESQDGYFISIAISY